MTRYDPAWLDRQYNNRARVPEHAEIFRRWAQASALARSQSPARIDLRYGPEPGETLDVFASTCPGAQAKAPVLVFIHGGYWRSLDKSDFSFVAPVFAQAGATVVVPNYGLCPMVTIEQIALQMTHALAWVWRHAAAHGGDPDRIVVVGHSAGGHLAALLLTCRWKDVGADLPTKLLTAAISISGLFDLEPLRHAPFLQSDLHLTPASVRRLSPAFFARPRSTLIALTGADESEEFIRQNQLIRDQWGPTTVPVCETIGGCHHFNILNDLVDPQGRTHRLVLQQLGLA
jgi:arylformamidase